MQVHNHLSENFCVGRKYYILTAKGAKNG